MRNVTLAILCFLACLSPLAAQTTKTYTTAENIQAGDLVLVDDDAKIRRADSAGWETKRPYSSAFPEKLFPLNSTTFLSQAGGQAYVVKIGADNSATVLRQFALGNDLVQLDGSHFVAYLKNQNPTMAYILTVTESATTYGPLAQLVSSGTTALFKVSNTRFVAAGNGYAQLFSVSNNSIQKVGASIAFPFKADLTGVCTGNRLLVQGRQSPPTWISSPVLYNAIIRINGDVISASDMFGRQADPIGALTNNRIVFGGISSSACWIGSVSDTGVTYGPILSPADSSAFTAIPTLTTFSDRFPVILKNQSLGWVRVSTLTASLPTVSHIGYTTSAVMLDQTYARAIYDGNIRKVNLNDAVYEVGRYIGVAEQTVSAGNSCTVTIEGGITKQFSNLIPGRWYCVTDQGLVLLTPRYQRPLIAGKAMSKTELKIFYSTPEWRSGEV